MAVFYILFELLIACLMLILLVHSIRGRKFPELSVMVLSAGTVLAGELINNFHSKATVYNSSFLMWIPGTEIPVFIICGGTSLSLGMFIAAGRFGPKCICRKLPVFIMLSLLFPLIELAGMGSGLWRWPGNPQVNLNWLLGVWEFYMLFIGLPALVGCLLPLFLKEKNKQG